MTDINSFASLVKRMRKLQTEYRKTHSWRTLETLKEIEEQVDFRISQIEV